VHVQVKVKGARKIGYQEFLLALDQIADKKGVSKEEIVQAITAAGGPVLNATQADAVKFHDDKSLYTGEKLTPIM
jgi:p25-alpha